MEVKAVELQLDTCVHWLEIALEHLANAKLALHSATGGERERYLATIYSVD